MSEGQQDPGLPGAEHQSAQGGAAGPPGERRVAWLLLALASLPALLRLWGLDRAGLWIDEAFTLSDSLHGALEDNPLGYRWMALWLETRDGRPSEADLRFLPALFGALCVPLTYWTFANRVGRRCAAGAALLLAVSSWHIYWSRSADFYTLAQALSLLGTGAMLRGLDRRLGAWVIVGLSLAGFAAWIHPSAAFVLPGLALLPFLPNGHGQPAATKSLRLGFALLIGAAVIAGFGWGSSVIEQWRRAKTPLGPAHLILTSGFFFQPWLLAAGLVGVWSAWRRPAPSLGAVALVPLVGFAAALGATPYLRLTAQYVFVLLPWVCVLAAGAWCRTPYERPEHERLAWSRLGAVTIFLVGASMLTQVALYFGPRKEERPAWREAYSLVADQREPGDLVLGMAAPIGEYYLTNSQTHLRELTQLEYLDTYRTSIERFWERRGRRTWFVVNSERLEEWRPELRERLWQVLRGEARLVASYPLEVESRDLSVSVFLRD